MKRLVGLPGEVVTIQNGAVRINGRAISPPESLRGLKYVTELDGPDEVLGTLQRPVNLAHEIHIDLGGFFRDEPWGTPRHPANFAVDEYFVLGDFSRASPRLPPLPVRCPWPPALRHTRLLSLWRGRGTSTGPPAAGQLFR